MPAEIRGPADESPDRVPSIVPIVAVGASAGGLDALRRFLAAAPSDWRAAIVVVQHLDPSHDALLPDLLQQVTALPVTRIRDGEVLQAAHVYVLLPDHDLRLQHGRLHLVTARAERGRRAVIDEFFQSAASAAGPRAVGVILSGMGTDGTIGLRAIKAAGGGTFAQVPSDAAFPAMPTSALESGVVDAVAPAAELAPRVADYLARLPTGVDTQQAGDDRGLAEVLGVLHRQLGHDFRHYKPGTIRRRIERRMALHRVTTFTAYAELMAQNPGEGELLFRELLIGVTAFFRDPEVWAQLGETVLPALLAARPEGGTLRAWVAGCSTGEEAYTLAMVCREAVEAHAPGVPWTIRIFATDLDSDAIATARNGRYDARIADAVGPERLAAHFVADGRAWRVRQGIRECVVFAPQNVAMDPPFTRLDLVVCRNVLIYLSPALQQRVLPLFHFSLNPGGVLVLGAAESVGAAAPLFEPLPGRTRLFRRRPQEGRMSLPPMSSVPPATTSASLPAEAPAASLQDHAGLEQAADRLLLERVVPAVALVTPAGDILYVRGPIQRYLAPAAGRANWTLAAMVREGLRAAVVDGLRRALEHGELVVLGDLAIEDDPGPPVRVLVEPLERPESLRGLVLVRFVDEPTPLPADPSATAGTADDLRRLRIEVHAARDEAAAVRRELQAANSELRSSNEDLQVANEELVTSQEELQSMNEELRTVNHELQAKLDELTQAGSDMANLLNSTEIATLFLDTDLRIRRFTTSASTLFRVRASDLGRPVTDLTTELRYPELVTDARAVLGTVQPTEREVPTGDGRWFAARVLPYRTLDDQPDGLVLTFSDITRGKQLEAALAAQLAARAEAP